MHNTYAEIINGFFLSHPVTSYQYLHASGIHNILVTSMLAGLCIIFVSFGALIFTRVAVLTLAAGVILTIIAAFVCDDYSGYCEQKYEKERLNNTQAYINQAAPIRHKYLDIFNGCRDKYCAITLLPPFIMPSEEDPKPLSLSIYKIDMEMSERLDIKNKPPVFISGIDIVSSSQHPVYLWGKVLSANQGRDGVLIYVELSTQDVSGKKVSGIYEMHPDTFMSGLVSLYKPYDKHSYSSDTVIPESGKEKGYSDSPDGMDFATFHSDTVRSPNGSSARVRFENSVR